MSVKEKILFFSLGAIVGGAGSWFYLKKKSDLTLEKKMSELDEELAEMRLAREEYLKKGQEFDENEKVITSIVSPETILEGSRSSDLISDGVRQAYTRDNVRSAVEYNKIKLPDVDKPDLPEYEIIEYDTYSITGIPLGYDSDCLEYYRGSDQLINDAMEEYDDIMETIGPEAYSLIQEQEGLIYVAAHKHGMIYEIASFDGELEYEEKDPQSGEFVQPEEIVPIPIIPLEHHNVFEDQPKILKEIEEKGHKPIPYRDEIDEEELSPYEKVVRKRNRSY